MMTVYWGLLIRIAGPYSLVFLVDHVLSFLDAFDFPPYIAQASL